MKTRKFTSRQHNATSRARNENAISSMRNLDRFLALQKAPQVFRTIRSVGGSTSVFMNMMTWMRNNEPIMAVALTHDSKRVASASTPNMPCD